MLTQCMRRFNDAVRRGHLGLILIGLLWGLSPLPARAVQLDIGDGVGTVGDTVDVAITTSDLTGLGVYAYEMTVTWTSNRGTVIAVPEAGTITAPWGLVTSNIQPGRIDVAAAGGSPLSGAGALLNLRFVLGPSSGSTTLVFSDMLFNEGTPQDTLSNGSLSVSALPSINITPDSGEIVVGDSLLFATYGSGTPPYTYTSSDPLVADFQGDWLHGLGPGEVTCTSTDDNGIMNSTTGVISVRALSLTAGNAAGVPGDTILVPLLISDPSPYGLISAEFGVTYSEADLTAIGTETAGTLAGALGWNVLSNVSSGRIDVSMAGTTSLPSAGILVYVRFVVDPGTSVGAPVFPLDGIFNENYPPKHYYGIVTITGFPVLNVTPNTATIVVGDNLGFSVSGGAAPPLTWGVTNNSVAMINGSGLLAATAAGQTRVFVVDNVGATDTTSTISICDLYVVAPTMTLWGGPTNVPIMLDRDVTGMGIYGYELHLTFDQTKVMFDGVSTAGTATAPWGTPIYNATVPGQLIVVHAGASPLSGSSPLLNLVFEPVLPALPASALTITKILFNEGDPCALVVNGSLTPPTAVPDNPPPRSFELGQNVPNPFNPTTTIDYSIDRPGAVTLRIYTTTGALVRTLVDTDHGAAGVYQAHWDGHDKNGRQVASGVYLYRLEMAGRQLTRKMVLLK